MNNTNTLEQLEYEDAIVSLNSMCQAYGAREVFKDFRSAYPDMFEEILVQINRLGPQSKVAALLR